MSSLSALSTQSDWGNAPSSWRERTDVRQTGSSAGRRVPLLERGRVEEPENVPGERGAAAGELPGLGEEDRHVRSARHSVSMSDSSAE